MKKCPNCNAENDNSAFYCHICGKKLKTKVNGWLICSIVFFISTILLSILTFNYADDVEYYSYKYHDLDNMLQVKNVQISNLESQMPQNYYTKYDNQNLYNRTVASDYEKKSIYYPQKGTVVTIYTTNNGYGLTEWGWIPMNCLEKY